jgi:F0F1-type ATP synthase membrane subunit b/b'
LENIKVDEPNYVEAQKLSAQYVTNLGIAETRREAERQAEEILKQAKEETQQLISNPPSDTQQLRGQIQGIVNQLRSVKPGTTAYAEAQQLLVSAQNRLKQ